MHVEGHTLKAISFFYNFVMRARPLSGCEAHVTVSASVVVIVTVTVIATVRRGICK
jgi:hypothetical protein